jgi:hypothetical protein
MHTHILTTLVLFAPTAVYAATYENPIKIAGVATIPDFLLALVDLVWLVGVPIIAICIIYAGFLFVTGGDNESKVAKARFVFMWTAIGAMVLLGAKGIAMAIQSTVLSLK